MDSISRIYFDVIGRDQGAQKVLGDAAGKAGLAHDAMSRLSGTLSSLGGPFGQVQMLAGSLTDSFDVLQEHGKNLRTALTAGGLGIAGLGVALAGFASKDQQAQSQLRQSITNTGRSYGDYGKQIEEAIRTEEGFGHTANDTQDALNTLTTATQSPTKALAEMGDVANLAAERNMTLAEAAGQLVRAQQGSTRSLMALGIHLDGVGTKTGQVNRALLELHNRLTGQAGAAVDSFGGKMRVLGAHVEDQIASWGKYAPVLTIAGSAMTLYAATLQRSAATQVAETVTLAANTRAQQANAVARGENAAAATAEAAAIGRAAGLEAAGGAIGTGMAANLGRGSGKLAALKYLPVAAVGAMPDAPTPGRTPAAEGVYANDAPLIRALPKPQQAAAWRALAAAAFGPDGQNTAKLKQLEAGWRKVTGAVDGAGGAESDAAKALIKTTQAAKAVDNSLAGQIAKMNAAQKTALDLSSAEDQLQGGMHTLAQSIHDGSRALQGHSSAASSNRDALRNLVTQEDGVIQSLQADHVGRLKVQQAAIQMSRAVEANATALGLNKGAVDRFLGSLHALPPQVAAALGATEAYADTIGQQVIDNYANGMAAAAPNAIGEAVSIASATAQALKGLRLSDSMDSGGPTASYVPKTDAATVSAQHFGQYLADTVVNSYAPAVDDGLKKATDKGLSKAEQRARARLAALRQAASQELQAARQFEQQQAQSYRSYASLSAQPTSGVGVQTFLNAKRNDLLRFVRDRKKLQDMGASDALIAQFDEAGPAASAAMEALMAQGRRAVHRASVTEGQINRISSRLARQQTREDFTQPLEKAINSLPPKLEHAFERAIKKHLHIEVKVDDGGSTVHRHRRSHHGSGHPS